MLMPQGKRFFVAIIVLGMCLPVAGIAASPEGWTKLFHGNSLEGWEVVPIGAGGGKWSMEEGVLKATRQPPDGGASWLVSRKDYEDFILRVKFRPNTTDYVTGLLIRDPGHAKIGRPAFNGFEVAFQRTSNGEDQDGSIYHVANSSAELVAPDQWTDIEVDCVGDHLIVLVNGRKASEAHSRRAYKGAIGFHLHGGTHPVNYEFKDLEIKELPPAPHPYQLMEERLSTDLHPVTPLFQSIESDFIGNNGGVWSIADGILSAHDAADDAVLLTKQSFRDFLLDFEYKIETNGSAGVLLRIPAPGDTGKGIEFHISNPAQDIPNGSLLNLARAFSVDPDNHPIAKPGAWTRGRVFASNTHVVTFINSEKGVDIDVKRSPDGRIGFRAAKGSTVQFRNVTVKRLDEQTAN